MVTVPPRISELARDGYTAIMNRCIAPIALTFLVLAISASFGDQSAPAQGGLKLKLDTIDQQDPCRDFAAAWSAGDKRFIAVRGFATDVPGVKEEIYKAAILSGNVNAIEGTSDRAPVAAQDAAIEYAEIFNRLLVRRLRLERDKRAHEESSEKR
jgi:hypothetical protein